MPGFLARMCHMLDMFMYIYSYMTVYTFMYFNPCMPLYTCPASYMPLYIRSYWYHPRLTFSWECVILYMLIYASIYIYVYILICAFMYKPHIIYAFMNTVLLVSQTPRFLVSLFRMFMYIYSYMPWHIFMYIYSYMPLHIRPTSYIPLYIRSYWYHSSFAFCREYVTCTF